MLRRSESKRALNVIGGDIKAHDIFPLPEPLDIRPVLSKPVFKFLRDGLVGSPSNAVVDMQSEMDLAVGLNVAKIARVVHRLEKAQATPAV